MKSPYALAQERMKFFFNLLSLMRPINSLMVGFAVMVGVAIASPRTFFSAPSLMGFLTGFFISSYSMVTNDYYDIKVDRINRPERPLPSGRVSLESAVALAALLLLAGLIASYFNGPQNFAIAATFSGLAWLYNYWGKRQGLIGNFMVAASVSVPFVYGGVAVGRAYEPLILSLALTAFLAASGREVVKSIADVSGDEVRGIRSVARVHGAKKAASLAASFFIAAVISSLVPIAIGSVGWVYGASILAPDLIFVYLAAKVVSNYSEEGAISVKKAALIGMLLGLVAFILGGILRS